MTRNEALTVLRKLLQDSESARERHGIDLVKIDEIDEEALKIILQEIDHEAKMRQGNMPPRPSAGL